MIQLKTEAQISEMKLAGRITGEALALAGEHIKPGVTTKYIDNIVRAYIEKCGAKPSFLGYGGFPGAACISINDEVIHGIPSKSRVIQDGDIVKVDVGAFYHGYHGDSANTFPCGNISDEAKRLIEATKESFYRGVANAVVGNRLGDIGSAVEEYNKKCGFNVVREFVGHGIGRDVHEDPNVPNYGTPGRGTRLLKGMTIAVEPMVCAGSAKVKVLSDNWTVVTCDGSLSAHYEHTLAITEEGPILLTKID
ncbi:MAG: type I methionyl aminopeptidase [Ruminococcaceae bacterium]|nr:type I methionyl aminopeptidase [Oscillospiraceae bacterium]